MAEKVSTLESWRAFRENDIVSEWGWLTLVGLFWLDQGANTIGGSPEAAISLPKLGDSVVGSIELSGDSTFFRPALKGFFVKGLPVTDTGIALISDAPGPPTDLRFDDYSLTVIRRSGQLAVRVRDRSSVVRTQFSGVRYFPTKENLHLKARFTRYKEQETRVVDTAVGLEESESYIGRIDFVLNGKTYGLEAQSRGAHSLHVTFRDSTSGLTTYGACRFLLANVDETGAVDLDFNRAFNPPCAFTPYATCSFPHPHNRLDFAVEAGELAPE